MIFDPSNKTHREAFRDGVNTFSATPDVKATLLGLLDYIDDLERALDSTEKQLENEKDMRAF